MRRGLAVVALVVAAAAAVWVVRTRVPGRADPLTRLPRTDLRLALASSDFAAARERLRGTAHDALLRELASPRLARRIGWAAGTLPPDDVLSSRTPVALGCYGSGWIRAASGSSPIATGGAPPPPASDAPRGAATPTPEGAVRVLLDARTLVGGASARGFRRSLADWLPDTADGVIRPRSGRAEDAWTLGGDPGLLDLLDPAPREEPEALGWTALFDDASAVEWFRLAPSRLKDLPGAAPALVDRIEDLERFLGLPLRDELAAALAGPGVLALRDPAGSGGAPRALLALDLARPDAARRALDRLLALGVLTHEFRVRNYRGVTVGSRPLALGGLPCEPAVAVDGDVLLLALNRTDLEDAMDRRRAHDAPERARTLRARLAGLGPASWKGASRSGFAAAEWAAILDIAVPRPKSPSEVEARLGKEGRAWRLYGSGTVPAWYGEALAPLLRWCARG